MMRHSGKVTWFNEKGGFGFIACDRTLTVFVDSDAMEEHAPLVTQGERVCFEIVESVVGPKARSVVRDPGGTPARTASLSADRLLAEEARCWRTTEMSGLQTILLIEENESLRAERREFLGAAGYLVAACHDVRLAAELYRSNLTIDLVIMSLIPAKSLQDSIDELDFAGPGVPVLLSSPAFPLDLWHEMQTRKLNHISGTSSMPVLLAAVRSILISAACKAA